MNVALSLIFIGVGFVILIAILGALLIIGLAVYRSRKNQIGKSANPTNELTPDQAAEITSTTNLLNP